MRNLHYHNLLAPLGAVKSLRYAAAAACFTKPRLANGLRRLIGDRGQIWSHKSYTRHCGQIHKVDHCICQKEEKRRTNLDFWYFIDTFRFGIQTAVAQMKPGHIYLVKTIKIMHNGHPSTCQCVQMLAPIHKKSNNQEKVFRQKKKLKQQKLNILTGEEFGEGANVSIQCI